MAVPAMVFQYTRILPALFLILAAAGGLAGCGAKTYESVGKSEMVSEESGSSENETGSAYSAGVSSEGRADSGSSGTESGTAGTPSDGAELRKTASGLETPETESADTIRVYVCGCVVSAGVYELPRGARIEEAIRAAGGLTENADETQVNQAGHLSDGMQITVPEKGTGRAVDPVTEEQAGEEDTSEQSSGAGEEQKVNLNTATAEELVTLSGIGESRAADIIAYREENGPFESIEEIMKVSGIKNALFEKIKEHITV